jgi:hypothetical protein
VKRVQCRGRRGNVLKPRLDPPRATGLNAPRELAMPDAVHHPQGSGQRGLVPREGLLERLTGPGAVVLVCAPARSRKTVLVRSWVEDSGLRAAWVSIDAPLEEPAVLVVDDLPELQSAEARRWLEVLLARRPLALRVVLSTREEPRLGLHRLRLAGELVEVRAPDLRSGDRAHDRRREPGHRQRQPRQAPSLGGLLRGRRAAPCALRVRGA